MHLAKKGLVILVNLDNLFILIRQKGLNAKKISDDTGISTGNISDWKSGRSMPTATKLDILATYLDCSVDYLLGRTDVVEVNRGVKIIVDDGRNVTPYMAAYDGSSPDDAKMSLKTIKQLDDEN